MGVVAFTGYRPEKLPFKENENDLSYLRFRRTLRGVIKRLAERGYREFISGLAIGFDTWVAEDVLELKSEYTEMLLECAIPFPSQADNWSLDNKLRRDRILQEADSSVVVSLEYSKTAFFVRNRYMVDKAEVVVCCYDGQSGGTEYTVNYALRKGKTVVQINPTDMIVSVVGKSFD